MVQLSTGDMLREARTSGTEMGRKVAEVMERGRAGDGRDRDRPDRGEADRWRAMRGSSSTAFRAR
jgi:hypothetical protein